MISLLLLTHLASAGAGAVLLWALSRLLRKAADLTPVEKERALRDQLNLATRSAGIGVWQLDIATKQVTSDATMRALLGISHEIKDRLEAIHPDDRDGVIAILAEAVSDPKRDIASIRHRITRPDGTLRHIQTHIRIFRDHHAKAEKMLGVTWDVTREVEHAEQLRQQTAHVQTLLDRLSVATHAAGLSAWEMDLRTEQLTWVGNRINAFGLDEVPLQDYGRSLDKLMVAEDRVAMRADTDEAIAAGKQTYSSRFRLVREGTTRHMQTYAYIVRDAGGNAARLVGATADITNEVQTTGLMQRQAEQERALFDRLNIATEAAGIAPWEVDMDMLLFVQAEQAILTLHGVTEFGGTTEEFFARVHPDDRAVFMDSVHQTLRAKRDRFSCRYRVPAADGSLVHIQTHARFVFDDGGRARRLLGVSWSITKEIEAAERLRQQAQMLRDAERRLERASLSSSEGHWESDLVGKRIWFSSSYHALLGYRDGELPHNISEFERIVHPDDLQPARAGMREHVMHGAQYSHDVRLRMKSGEYRWFRQRGMAERDANGWALSMSGSIQDIHEQKLAEDALRLAQRRFERAIKGTQDGLWELEANGTSWCSPRVAELLGYSPEELPSDTNFLRSFLHANDVGAVANATQSHFQQEVPYDIEIRLRTKGGEYRWYRARATAERDTTGQPLRLSGSLQDVTEARGAREELLRATEAAELANQAKSEFLANVSHEIRTPMNGILGMTGLMLDTALDRTQRDYAETIRSSADSLLIVINDILDFSKIEAGKLDIESIDLDLRGNVEDVATMMAFQAAAKNLELVVHVHPDVPGRVMGDPQRVRQCLINLVGNAIKFTRHGEIVIEVSSSGRRDGRVLTQFEVRDTGIGVSSEVLETLFQPFVQADSSTTRHFGGTGLGLSIVRRLVEMMGGQVGARSELSRGSSFWFTLPLEPIAPTASLPVIDLNRLGRRVLVVDDNETNRRVLAGQLMHAGYEVSLAGAGIEALGMLSQAVADNHPFEVVLADYRMQDMDGAALGERINADPQLSQARIVMLTSMDRHGDIHRFASLGFAAYLTKPIRARELFACMDRVLARDSKEWHLQSQPIVTRGALVNEDKSRRYQCSVLLVEDNAVNQKVAVRFLERMGCRVRVADNGAEGVRAYGEAAFDIVLMDLQMPVMDGLTATRRIRELEGQGKQTPIVALTANAMSGQLERCMEAGMNGFLTKPLEISRLHETLDRYGFSLAAADKAADAAATQARAIVNLARLNEITDGDPEFTRELIATFIASGEQVMQEVRSALGVFDRPALSRAAHKLKGASANIHAEALRDLAFALEMQAPSLDQPRLRELIEQLAAEFARAAEFLRLQTPELAAKAG
jgi:two-component system, sensor histidine kinase and response regulator